MASQPDIPEGQSRFLRESGKNARMQRQYFNRAGEPMYSSLLMALMDRAGLNPMSLLHPQRNQGPSTSQTGNPASDGGAGGGLQFGAPPPPMPVPQASPMLAGEKSQSPSPGLGMGQPGVMTGAAGPIGASMAPPPQPDFTGRLSGVMGGQRDSSPFGLRGAGGGNQNGGGNPNRINVNRGGGLPNDHSQIYQNPDAPGLPDPRNIGNSQGWTDTDRMAWQTGVSNINNQFGNLSNRAAFQTGQNVGPGANSIGAGLQAQLARDQGQAMTGLANQVTMQGIQQQDARLNQLMQALGPLIGFPAQAAQAAQGTAAGYGQTRQQQPGLSGLGALAYLFA